MAHFARTTSIVLAFGTTGLTALGVGLATADVLAVGSTASSSMIGLETSTATPVAPVTVDIEHPAHAEPPLGLAVVHAAPLTDAQQELVDWAKGRFAQAGLELPELTVRFDPTRELCGHNDGRYQHAPDGERIVTICTRDSDLFAADLDRRRTLLHEFGHAWDFANLSDDDHDELGHLLGVESWNDHDAAWEDRGVERFAETFVYSLLDQPRRQLKVDLGCDDLIGVFQAATGAQPIGPGVPHCAA